MESVEPPAVTETLGVMSFLGEKLRELEETLISGCLHLVFRAGRVRSEAAEVYTLQMKEE